MAQVPVYTPDEVTDLQAARVPFQGGETAQIRAAGQMAIARSVGRIEHATEEATVAALRVKAEFDRDEVEARLADLGSKRTEIDTQVLKLQGKGALGSKDQALGMYDDATRALESTLSNAEQKAMFADRVREQRMVAERQWWIHEAQQLELQGEQDFAAGQDRRVSDAGLLWKVTLQDGRSAAEVQLQDGLRALADRAVAKGWSEERLLLEQRNYRARVVSSYVLNAIANPSDYGSQQAREFLLKYSKAKVNEKGEVVGGTGALMDADVIHKLWNAIHAGGVRDEVRTEFMRIRQGAKKDANSGLVDLQAEIDEARKIKNPEVADHVEAQLRQQWAIDNEIAAHNDALNAAGMNDALDKAYQNNQPIFVNEADPRWVAMSEIGRQHVRSHATSLISATRAQRQAELQQAQWLLMSLPPSERAKANIDALFPSLDQPRRNALKATVVKAQEEVAKDAGINADRIHALAKDAAQSFPWGKDAKKLGRFISHIDAELAAQFPDKSKPATFKGVNDVIGQHLLYGDTGGLAGTGLFAINRTWWEAEMEGKTEKWKAFPPGEQPYAPNQLGGTRAPPPPLPGKVKPIPPEEQARIDAALRRQGKPLTEQNRLDVWLTYPQSRE